MVISAETIADAPKRYLAWEHSGPQSHFDARVESPYEATRLGVAPAIGEVNARGIFSG
jgi:hypothetical protein